VGDAATNCVPTSEAARNFEEKLGLQSTVFFDKTWKRE
jgi:hypothetical protein